MVDITGIEVQLKSARQAATDADRLERNLDKLGKTGSRVERQADRIGGAFDRMSRLIKTGLGAFGITTAFDQLKNAALNTEALGNQLKFATGNAIEAGNALDFVRETSNKLGLVNKTAAQSFATLAASAKGTSLAGEGVQEMFEGIASASSVLNLTADQTAGVITAFSQALSKGKLQTEELLQVSERVPGTMGLVARAMGVTGAELSEMLQKGEVLAEDALPKIAAEMQRAFGADAVNAAQGLRGELANLQNSFDDLLVAASGGTFKELATGGVRVLRTAIEELTDHMHDLVTAAGIVASMFVGRFAASLVTAVKGMSAAAGAAGLLRGSLALLGGPVGVGVAAAGALFILTTRTSEASDAIDIAREANETLNKVLRDTENLTLSAAEAARAKANQDLLGAQASLIAAEAENKLVVARSGRLLAGTPLPESAGLQLTRETKEISALSSEIDKLFDKLLKADEAVRKFQRTAKETGTTTGNLGGETGKLTKELTDMERAQAKLTKALIEYEGREMVRQIERQFEASEKLTDGTLDIADAMREVTEQTGPFREAFENTFRRLDDAGSNFWQNLLEGGKNAFGSLKDLATQTGAEILHALTTRRLTAGISAALIPGMAAAGPGMGAMGGGGGFSLAGMGTSLLNAGVSPFTNASTWMQSAGLSGSLGIAAGGALPGLGVGALTTMLTGGSGVGNAIGGALGGALGNVLLPGIGGLVGSALGGLAGGLFGGSKKAKIRLGGGAGGFEDSVFSQSAFGNIGLAGSRTKRVDAAEFKPFFDSIAQLDNLMASSLIPEQIDKVRASLEGFTSSKLTSSDPFRPEQLEQLIRERMGVIFNAVGGDISRLAQSFRDLPIEEMVQGFNALNQVSRFADSRPLEDFGKALRANNQTLMEATRASRNSILELVNVFDGSLDATQRLAAATQQRYALELQLLDQINNVSKGITSSFESTRETIIRAGLSQEQLFDRIASQAEGLIPQLMQATDPARIGEIAGQINTLTGEAFRMLNPEQQQGVQPGFLDFLGRTEGLAQGRLADVQQTAVRENGELRKVIRDELGLVVRDQRQTAELEARTAENNRAAAEAQLQAARMQVDAARQEGFYAGLNAGSRR